LEPQPEENWKLLPDVTPAIMSKELFERVQAVVQRTKELRPGRPFKERPSGG